MALDTSPNPTRSGARRASRSHASGPDARGPLDPGLRKSSTGKSPTRSTKRPAGKTTSQSNNKSASKSNNKSAGKSTGGASPTGKSIAEMTLAERRRATLTRLYGSEDYRTRSARSHQADQETGEPVDRRTWLRERLGPAPAIYYTIMMTVAVFVMLGLVMVLSATSVYQVSLGNSPYAIFTKQATWAGLGLAAMIVVNQVTYRVWRFMAIPLMVGALGLMVVPFVSSAGAQINGARSWIRYGEFSIQPSEALKLATIVFLAWYFARNERAAAVPRTGIIPLGIVLAVVTGISFVQGDLGSAIVLGAITLAVGLVAGVPFMHIASVTGSGIFLAAIAILSDTRRYNRLVAFRDIEGTKEHLGFQSWQSLLSIANGGLTGSGVGGSKSKLGYLPLAHSDFIFAVIADELGLIGAIAVIGGFMMLVFFGMQAALAAPDRFGMLLGGGIAAWFGMQALVHLGGVVGLIPVTGLTLPFFSAGGSSLLMSMTAAGLLLNVARRAVTDRSTGAKRRHPRGVS